MVKVLGRLSHSWLTCSDFACISRFVTRASLEKQLSIFAGNEVTGVYVLLLGFLKQGSGNCRLAGSVEGETEAVMHEVIRGVAQLALLSEETLHQYRAETLQELLHYADPRRGNPDTRFSALDGIGNVFAVFSSRSLAPPTFASVGNSGTIAYTTDRNWKDEQVQVNVRDLLAKSPETPTSEGLLRLHTDCAQCLINNMSRTVYQFTSLHAHSVVLSNSLCPSIVVERLQCAKLLASTLRALCSAVVAATAGTTFTLSADYSTLLNVAQQVVDKVLPLLAVEAPALSPFGAGVGVNNTSSATVAVRVWRYALRFLAALAAYDPSKSRNACQSQCAMIHLSVLRRILPCQVESVPGGRRRVADS